jgi:hypothetical protein
LRRLISLKLEEGDFKGAIRLASSVDAIAPSNEATYAALLAIHPHPHPLSSLPPAPSPSDCPLLSIPPDMIGRTILSFPPGSAGGPDGLRPQHLKDLINTSSSSVSSFLASLSAFVSLVLKGETPAEIRPLFFGARLTAINKKGGGIRPIAVGCTLRRLVAKIASSLVLSDLSSLLASRQLGYGVKGGAESAVHAARWYLQNLRPGHGVLKLDFRNAFNSIRRDIMLHSVIEHAPLIYPLVFSCYSSPTSLFWEGRVIMSAEGVQQGDPLGPLLFCLTLHNPSLHLCSELCILYLDDFTLGGEVDTLLQDLDIVMSLSDLGLCLNTRKSEIICSDMSVYDHLLPSLPDCLCIDSSDACLLGSPLGNVDCISAALRSKITSLNIVGERLKALSAHDSIIILRHSFAIP